MQAVPVEKILTMSRLKCLLKSECLISKVWQFLVNLKTSKTKRTRNNERFELIIEL